MRSKSFKLKELRKEIDQQKANLPTNAVKQVSKAVAISEDPVVFARDFFGFDAKEYQAGLLRDMSKRIVVRWSRQAGKTTCIALRAIWFACMHPKTLTLIVAPTLRQSMIMADRIQDFLAGLPKDKRSELVEKFQRTIVRFRNGSRIVALPNSPQLLRGYTAAQVITDESGFFKDDRLVFYNVLYPMLSTTDGTLIASSTPWSKDSVFFRMCQAPEFSKHTITCEDVIQSGLVKQSFIDEMRSQLPFERFQREFMSEFVEDIDAWLTQSLIVSCIDSQLLSYDFQAQPQGNFYMGVDFGKEQDFSVVLLIEKQSSMLRVVHVHRFPLHSEYASVIGYIKSLQDRWKVIRAIYSDVTGVGNYIVEDMVRSGIQGVTGITFTVKSKEEMATILREKMRSGEVKIPYVPTRKLDDIDLTAELNIEKFELMKTGHLRFSHPEGGHDDVFWSIALGVYGAVQSPLPGRGAVMLPH
jgi:phage FluMu gp28-like protein